MRRLLAAELAALAVMAALFCGPPAVPGKAPEPHPQLAAPDDRPLLDERQKEQARTTGAVAFDCCGTHYVIESGAQDLLRGYI